MFEIGTIIHSVQDFYSHSNYAEIALKYYTNPDDIPLYEDVMNNQDKYEAKFVEDLKKNLHTGTYGGHEEIIDNNSGPDSHGAMNKDEGKDTEEYSKGKEPVRINSAEKVKAAATAEKLAEKATKKLLNGGDISIKIEEKKEETK